jgi:hypothetical protein
MASAVLLAAGLSACASSQQNGTASASDDIVVRVENMNFYEARIYLRSYGGIRHRLGEVPGNSTRTFRTRWISPDLQIEVSFLAGGGRLGERIPVVRGDTIDVTIPP